MKYILGVDGGNTKTDYYLFDNQGDFIDMHRGGTCSHEGLPDSFEGTYRVMKQELDLFLGRHSLTPLDISSSVFGLAGCDLPYQHESLCIVIERLGFKHFKVVNDSALAIKVGTTNGYGVCSINGTGTSVSAIDKCGNHLQVGGIGAMSFDFAGGRFLSREVVKACYSELFRFDKKTSLTPIVLKLLNNHDETKLMEDIVLKFLEDQVDYNILTIACFEEANKGDEVAIDLLTKMADCCARNAAAAVVRMDLGEHPEVVLAGSVYVKGCCPILVNEFKTRVNFYSKKECFTKVLSVPPATGAIVWAYELETGVYPSMEVRQQLIRKIENAIENRESGN